MAIDGIGLPFAEQIAYLRQKVNLPTDRWDDLRHGGHVRGFSVAGVTRDDILTTFRREIERAATEGGDLDQFRKVFDDVVDRTGWSFRARGSTEETRRAWRARVIFETNMRTSYMAGRYAQLRDPDLMRLRPYWRYRHGDSRRPRPLHLAWDGLVLGADDPWWDVHFPPNGWGCKCDVEAIGPRQLARMGRTGPDQAPPDGTWTGKDPRTGESETRHLGVDRGWEYNVGRSWVDGLVPREMAEPMPPHGTPPQPDLPPLPEPEPFDPDLLMPDGLADDEYVGAFLAEFGAKVGKPVSFRDPSGGIITVSERMFEKRDASGTKTSLKTQKRNRHRYMRLYAAALKRPDEIWGNWAKNANGELNYVRLYLKRYMGKPVFTAFQWSAAGWVGTTAFDTNESYIHAQRYGALLFRRK